MNTRAKAATVLAQVLPVHQNLPARRSLADALPDMIATDPNCDKGLLQEICYGVCRWYTRLDQVAHQLMTKPFKARDCDVHCLILVGLYQLYYLRIPDHAAVSETVNASRELNKAWASKVINGILRRALREKATLLSQISQSDAVQTAHPKWLIDMISTAWPDQWKHILEANNQQAPMTLRVNQRKASRSDYMKLLHQAGIKATECQWAEQGITLKRPCDVQSLPGYEEGLFSVQDEAAQMAAEFLNPQPGDQVLDACAAPGGKTTHILERQPKLTQVVAVDSDTRRSERIRENLNRLNLHAQVIVDDVIEYAQHSAQPDSFDRILLDAPCSATGVIRRHPDIKWLRKRTDIASLANTQLSMLETLWPLLKPGGTLLYATCSILPQENERVIGQFLKQQIDACEQILVKDMGMATRFGRQLFPQPNQHDGFYYACLRKKAPSP